MGILLSWFGYDLLGLIGLIILGLVIIFLARLIIILIPAAVVAFTVWYISNGNTWLAGVAFLVIAALSILKKTIGSLEGTESQNGLHKTFICKVVVHMHVCNKSRCLDGTQQKTFERADQTVERAHFSSSEERLRIPWKNDQV